MAVATTANPSSADGEEGGGGGGLTWPPSKNASGMRTASKSEGASTGREPPSTNRSSGAQRESDHTSIASSVSRPKSVLVWLNRNRRRSSGSRYSATTRTSSSRSRVASCTATSSARRWPAPNIFAHQQPLAQFIRSDTRAANCVSISNDKGNTRFRWLGLAARSSSYRWQTFVRRWLFLTQKDVQWSRIAVERPAGCDVARAVVRRHADQEPVFVPVVQNGN